MVKWFSFRRKGASAQRSLLYYDTQCGFCVVVVRWLDRSDIFGSLEFRTSLDAAARRAGLDQADLNRAAFLVTPAGATYEGFYAFRQLALRLPLLWPLAPLAWTPGSAFFGVPLYRWIAEHRGAISQCGFGGVNSPPS